MTREEAEKEVEKLGLSGQARAQKINELIGNKASDFEGGSAKENKKKSIKEKLVASPEDMKNMTKDRADVKGAVRRSEIANPSVGVVDRITGNVTGLNEDLFDPTAVKAKDLDETGNLKKKEFRLGGETSGDFIGASSLSEKVTGSDSSKENVAGNNKTSSNISDFDKKFLNDQTGVSDYQKNEEMEKQRKDEVSAWNDINNTIESSRNAFKNIDDHYIDQLPTFAAKRFFNGEFGDPKSNDAKLRLAHFMINGLQSKLKVASNLAMANAGKSPMFADTSSDYEKLQNTNLEQGLANRWNKYKQETDAAAELARKQGVEEQDIKNSLRKISANANMQSAFNMMTEKQKAYAIKVIAEIGDKIKNFNRDDVTNFLIGALVSDKNFNSNDLLAAMGVKLGTDVLDSDTAQTIIEKIKNSVTK